MTGNDGRGGGGHAAAPQAAPPVVPAVEDAASGAAPRGAPPEHHDRARRPRERDRSAADGAESSPRGGPERARAAGPRFRSVVLDVDSTLCGIEGVDWLAARRGAAAAREVARLTERAMGGEIPLGLVYGERLAMIRPSAAEVAELAAAYEQTLAPGAAGAVAELGRQGVRVLLVSGGLREAILPVAARLGVAPSDVHAVSVRFDAAGGYAGFDTRSPLATQGGKLDVVRALGLLRPALAVGDGATDLAARPGVDAFAAFTGFVRRAAVVAGADFELASFDHLLEAVLR